MTSSVAGITGQQAESINAQADYNRIKLAVLTAKKVTPELANEVQEILSSSDISEDDKIKLKFEFLQLHQRGFTIEEVPELKKQLLELHKPYKGLLERTPWDAPNKREIRNNCLEIPSMLARLEETMQQYEKNKNRPQVDVIAELRKRIDRMNADGLYPEGQLVHDFKLLDRLRYNPGFSRLTGELLHSLGKLAERSLEEGR